MTQHVMIVDDDEGIRASLSSVLHTYGFRTSSFEAASKALEAARISTPDCIVLDIRMPDMDGLTAQRIISETPSSPPVILITGHGDIPMAVRAMKNGAFEFVEKPIDDEKLVVIIRAAIESHRQSSQNDIDIKTLSGRYARLTAREQSVASMVADGYSTAAIAASLEISNRTVDHHRASILAKMQATTLPQLLRFLLALNRRPHFN